MTTYQERKEVAREKAVQWQMEFEQHNYSYGELAVWSDYFKNLAKRYGLTEEFRENAII